mmetsp:Transcript_34313/g.99659  ORF Transcript_34313/g.99659 Transcript_34313/m.99659 type:complete len:354 (+) Transcript_34313:83-1144(+)
MKRPAAKRARVDPFTRQCNEAVKGLYASEASRGVVQMLEQMLPMALVTPRTERDKYQQSVVAMAEELLTGHEAELVKALQEAEAEVASCDATAKEKNAVKDRAAEKMAGKEADMQAKKVVLAEAATVFRSAKAAVEKAEGDLDAHMVSLRSAGTKKARLEQARADYLMPLSEGVEDAAKNRELVDALAAVLVEFGADEGMAAAMPTAFGKSIGARGSFDTMVIDKVTQEINRRIAAFEEELAQGEPGKAAKESALQAAVDALTTARDRQLETCSVFTAARKEYEAAMEVHHDAVRAVKAIAPERRKLVSKVAVNERRLAAHRETPLGIFVELRDREALAAEPEAEEPAEAPEA